jgi:alpha-mannosidase
LLNDSRYGWDKPADNTLRLSLLYSPQPGRSYTYQARQDFGHHVFTYSLVGHEGALNAVEAVREADRLNSPLRTFHADRHAGTLGKQFSFVSSDNKNVVVRALKRAEVSNEYVIRVYEMSGKGAQQARISFPAAIVKAVEADGTERTLTDAKTDGTQLLVDIKPYSVKTYKVQLAGQKSAAVDAQSVALDFDRHCFSFNEFRTSGNFEGGNSYAAELLPDEGITVGDIPFTFGEKDAANGLTCKGQTLQLPTDKDYRHLYLLVASDNDDRQATFTVAGKQQTVGVPYYTGFIGQWGHDGQTVGYLKDAEVAWVGSHRHSGAGDEPYEFTYMFRVRIDLPKGVREVQLPADEHVVVFAATVANDANDGTAAAPLFQTSILPNAQTTAAAAQPQVNLLCDAKVIATSGEVNNSESAAMLMDGDPDTKWCDAQAAPNYVVFDFGKPTTITRWRVLSAACEQSAYITRTCLLQGRNSDTEEWQTLDMFEGNRNNYTDRSFTATSVRYLRLFVIAPTQGQDSAARIYELEVY